MAWIIFSLLISVKGFPGPTFCDGNPDKCPNFENQCRKSKESRKIEFTSPLSGFHHVGHCKNGLPDGDSQITYKDGKIFTQGKYSAGKREGLWKDYDPNGQLVHEGVLSQNRLVNSYSPLTKDRQIWNYENGKLVSQEFYKSDKPVRKEVFIEKENSTLVQEFRFEKNNWVKDSEREIRNIDPHEGRHGQ